MDVNFKICGSIGSEIKNRCFVVAICGWKINQDGVNCNSQYTKYINKRTPISVFWIALTTVLTSRS